MPFGIEVNKIIELFNKNDPNTLDKSIDCKIVSKDKVIVDKIVSIRFIGFKATKYAAKV